jgi:hypothetical protein
MNARSSRLENRFTGLEARLTRMEAIPDRR